MFRLCGRVCILLCALRTAAAQETYQDTCEMVAECVSYLAGIGVGWFADRCLASDGMCGAVLVVCCTLIALGSLLAVCDTYKGIRTGHWASA